MGLAYRIATGKGIQRNYSDLYDKQRPQHPEDSFFYRHPNMDPQQRAKLFQPYDALDGYSDALRRRRRQYEPRRILSEEDRERLNRQLRKLFRLCPNSRAAAARNVVLSVTYFVPNDLPDTDDRHGMGDYVTYTGLLRSLDPVGEYLIIDDTHISFSCLYHMRCLSIRM
ncbi:MAG: hypothetical protein IJ229_14280 [Clostridia bacterium]|nr:hypothetical protein [Clostridia bacterium]MBR1685314.1 hypothetical protein [Clostridia bacterium]MBR2288592.1 hypothetical protein [Clostridia bacterium]